MNLHDIMVAATQDENLDESFTVKFAGERGVDVEMSGNQGALLTFMLIAILRNGMTAEHVAEALAYAEAYVSALGGQNAA